jgi:Zn-dependent protease/CBS domain-containing protein
LAIKLGNIYGIPLYLDYSWFIIFVLIAYTVGFGLMPESYPGLSSLEYLSIGLLSAILLFVSIVVHELAHSIIAKRNGLKIGKITLYLLGGVSEMEEEPPTANLELKMSAAGPLTSIAIAVLCLLGWVASIDLHASVLVQGPLQYAVLVNALVAGFNLIPAFPMDGGRVLRSILWRSNKDLMKSTMTASKIGRVFAYLIMFAGIFFLIFVDLFDGLWLILIGWFISSGASNEMNRMIMQRDLANLKADDIMTRTIDSVSPDITLTELSSEFLQHKHNGFPVIGGGNEMLGCITVEDLRRVQRSRWDSTFVRDVMTPKERLVTVKESDSAQQVAALMSKNQIGRIFVLNDRSGLLAGIITRSDIIKTIQVQESILGESRRGSLSSEKEFTISVETGMMFEIEAPQLVRGSMISWSVSFNTIAFSLVSEKVIQLSGGGQSTQYTFQALRKGKFSIILYQGPSSGGISHAGRNESIRYSIIVS